MRRITALLTALLSLSVLSTSNPALAQDEVTKAASAVSIYESEKQLDELTEQGEDRILLPAASRTPLQTLLGFRKAFRAGQIDLAAQYLDLRYIDGPAASIEPAKLAQALSYVWIQQNVFDLASISDSPEGHQDDDLPSYRDQVGQVQMADHSIPVLLQRIPDGEGGQVWRISNATVAKIPEMWEEHGYSDFAIKLGQTLPKFVLFGMQNWQVVLLLAALVAHWFLSGWMSKLCLLVSLRIPNQFPDGIRRFWHLPMRLIMYVLLLRATINHLGLSVTAKVYLQSSPLEYIALTALFGGLLTLWRDWKIRRLEASNDIQFIALLKPLVLIIKITVVITAILLWAHNAGFNISTIVAGLGVGSLAIALAAQKTMENIIGAVTLYAARPIKPGDFCRFGTIKGTVEEIGLRSVTLRTLERTVVSIPNAQFAAVEVENISARERIRYFTQLRVEITQRHRLDSLLNDLRSRFTAQSMLDAASISIRLEKIEDGTALIRIDAGVVTRDFQAYLAVAEELNLEVIEACEHAQITLSGPSQSVQIHADNTAALSSTSIPETTS